MGAQVRQLILAAIATPLMISVADARCNRYPAPDLQGTLLSFEQYIDCLNERQVMALNQHADLIDKLSRDSEVNSSLTGLVRSIDLLANANATELQKLSSEKMMLERRVKDLEARIQVLFDERELRSGAR